MKAIRKKPWVIRNAWPTELSHKCVPKWLRRRYETARLGLRGSGGDYLVIDYDTDAQIAMYEHPELAVARAMILRHTKRTVYVMLMGHGVLYRVHVEPNGYWRFSVADRANRPTQKCPGD